ncbi:RNA 2',3'-cyclic phosphodiesterase [Clostridium fungisolvens]|uniref:RNA 2',3'-cyclic phosphodiesterase n=1 Tax=Clostridium fungisolvens TaxID=1604897 RepID=A0A6V8SK45_9CLOT|nr:RNA 2',3'-cyclic phosphodiesterase [Clostridium fungisolvens]GFP75528.1 RNA 2',3'-cyclic phosphodiesterase [Clostridium fungisolvens]
MRVYIAIDFEDNIKNYFGKMTSYIKNHCSEGSFTEKNNFHMTIRFIGEADDLQISKIKEVMDIAVLKISSFELLLNNLGIFKRKKTNILWAGVEESPVLTELHKELSTLLKEYRLPFYDKLFMPHITLGRRIELKEESTALDSLIQFERITIPVKAISLMASKEIDGKLNGVPLYKVNLE